jgi:hypothetical protein
MLRIFPDISQSTCCHINKNSVTRYLASVLFIEQLLLAPIDMPRMQFEFDWIFLVLFIFIIISPAIHHRGVDLNCLGFDFFQIQFKDTVLTVHFMTDCPCRK